MTTAEKLSKAIETIRDISPDQVRLYATGLELRKLIELRERALAIDISQRKSNRHNSTSPFSPELDSALPSALINDSLAQQLATLHATQRALEGNSDYHRAVERIAPLHETLVQLQAQDAKEKLERQEAEAKLADALRVAQVKALEKAAVDPEVLKHRKALELAFPDSQTTRKVTKRSLEELSEEFAPAAPAEESPVK